MCMYVMFREKCVENSKKTRHFTKYTKYSFQTIQILGSSTNRSFFLRVSTYVNKKLTKMMNHDHTFPQNKA